jgi:O-antigen/teichoic acid export membrane protein
MALMTPLTSTPSQAWRNVASIWLNRLLNMIVPLATTPIIAQHFGLAMMGVWLLATQLASHLILLDAGLANSLIRLLARESAATAANRRAMLLGTTFYALSAVAMLLLVASPFLSSAYTHALGLEAGPFDPAWQLMMLTIVSVVLTLPMRMGYGMLGSQHRFDLIQACEGGATAVRFALIVLAFNLSEPSLLDLGVIVFGCSIAGTAAIFVLGLRMQPSKLLIAPSQISREMLREMWSMSGAAAVVTLGNVLLTQASATLSGYFLDTRSVTLIAVPLFIFTAITPFFNTFAAIAAPMAAAATSHNDRKLLHHLYRETSRYLVSAAFFVSAFLVVAGERLLNLWLAGPNVHAADLHEMAIVLSIIFAAFALSVAAPLGKSILMSIGEHWPAARAELLTSVAGVALGCLLMTQTNLGLRGMAIGIGATLALRGLVVVPMLLGRYFRCTASRLITDSLTRPLLVTVVTIGAAVLVERILGSNLALHGLVAEAAGWGVALLVWAGGTWFVVVPGEHRRSLRARFVNPRSRAAP